MEGQNKITHRELLTFNNLTNFEWEFAHLSPERKTDQNGNQYYEYDKLIDLLTPEVFAIRDEDGNIERYIYGEDEEGNYEEQQGLIQMRKEAGIAME